MPSGSQSQFAETLKACLLLAAFTLLTRAWIFGDPVVNIDEQFYLMVGDRLSHGELPYVDIWDRKPIGLFLIYAFACRVFADPALGYQLLAAIAVALTSAILYHVARKLVSFPAALAGAASYPAWLLVFGGVAGQSPVYYNLPMAAAAALTLSAFLRPDDRHLTARGCAIMLLAGIAMQIKYTAIFEGIFFGLSLLWTGRAHGRSLPRLAADGALWIASALAPTLAACAAFFAMGHAAKFVQTNFLSIFGDTNPALPALGRLASLCFGLSPFWVCLWLVWLHRRAGQPTTRRTTSWIMAWLGAAFAGFLIFGVWNDHYVLPLLAPLSLIAALAFDRVARQRVAVALVVGLGLAGGIARTAIDVGINGTAREVSRIAAMVSPQLGSGCLYVNEDLAILYLRTRSCLPTRYVFPQHLALLRYQHALGIDQLAELNATLSRRPSVIVISTEPDDDTRPASRQLLEAHLARNYRQTGTAAVGETTYAVFALVKPN